MRFSLERRTLANEVIFTSNNWHTVASHLRQLAFKLFNGHSPRCLRTFHHEMRAIVPHRILLIAVTQWQVSIDSVRVAYKSLKRIGNPKHIPNRAILIANFDCDLFQARWRNRSYKVNSLLETVIAPL